MRKTFYSNGKLLITSEYLVLDGAIALALPTKFGQNLAVETCDFEKKIYWKSYDSNGEVWFETVILFSEIIKNKFTDHEENTKNTLTKILHEANLLNPNFISNSNGFNISTQLTFPRKWGLGTSSTLINNIAQWANIDAFELLKNSFGGSGYDIACAQNNNPILYRLINEKPVLEKVIFDPNFKKNIYFVYLNKKQNSKTAISNFRNNQISSDQMIQKINHLTLEILKSDSLKHFEKAIKKHELLVSNILKTQTVQESLFPDFEGTVKSLGAWGGDFVMAICKDNPTHYFASKGFEIILTFDEMIL